MLSCLCGWCLSNAELAIGSVLLYTILKPTKFAFFSREVFPGDLSTLRCKQKSSKLSDWNILEVNDSNSSRTKILQRQQNCHFQYMILK